MSGFRCSTALVFEYIRDEWSSVTRPAKELNDFGRIAVEPGETETVELTISPEKLAFYDINMDFVVEPGQFAIIVGASSGVKDLNRLSLTIKK